MGNEKHLKLTQNGFISAVSEMSNVSKATVKQVINAASYVISQELRTGGEVQLSGLGKFSVRERAARTGRNPATGETMTIPAKKQPRFSASAALKAMVAGNEEGQ